MPDPHASLAVQGLQGPDETIQQDLPCSRCGYNLRGLTLDMACPECSAPVGSSIHGDLLGFADPDWLDKLRRGTLLKLWSMLLALISAVILVAAARLGASQQIELVVGLPAAILGVWAVFLITSQEPRISLQNDTVTLRKVVRVCAVIGASQGLLSAAFEPVGSAGRTAVSVALVPLMFFYVIAVFGEFVYYRRFARRIPDKALVRSTTIVMWGLGTTFAILAIGTAIRCAVAAAGISVAASGGGAPTGAGLSGMICFGCATGVGGIVFGILYVLLLFSYKKAFTVAAASARAAEAGAHLG